MPLKFNDVPTHLTSSNNVFILAFLFNMLVHRALERSISCIDLHEHAECMPQKRKKKLEKPKTQKCY